MSEFTTVVPFVVSCPGCGYPHATIAEMARCFTPPQETGIERYWREQEQAELQFEHQIRALADITLAKRRADVDCIDESTCAQTPNVHTNACIVWNRRKREVGLSGLTPHQFEQCLIATQDWHDAK